jgi:molybdopterin-guanine dinucleotide biosynthesis protein MobB
MKIVFVVGTKNSGKTTVSEFLVKSLSERGLKVATVKHIHHEFTIDTEGKDTFRMRKAGARLVISFSPSEIAILRPPGNVEEEFEELSEQMVTQGFDYLVVEGFKIMSAGVPSVFRVLTCKTTEELDSLIPAMLPNIDCISGVVSSLIAGSKYRGVPVIKFPAEGSKLVRRVME